MLIALLNKSSRYSGNPGLLTQIASAVSLQLSKHVVPAWGIVNWNCIYFSNEKDVPANAYRLWILNDSDQADALGYHDQDPQGFPYGRVFVNPIIKSGGTDFSGPNSVSVTISHEACEILGDPEVNCWRQMPDGNLTCQELCDAVEGDAYPIDINGKKIFVSNFLLPAWFDLMPPKGATFDYMKKLNKNFSMSKGGYMIVMTGGNVDNVYGSKSAKESFLKNSSKAHQSARGFKRKNKLHKAPALNDIVESEDKVIINNNKNNKIVDSKERVNKNTKSKKQKENK